MKSVLVINLLLLLSKNASGESVLCRVTGKERRVRYNKSIDTFQRVARWNGGLRHLQQQQHQRGDNYSISASNNEESIFVIGDEEERIWVNRQLEQKINRRPLFLLQHGDNTTFKVRSCWCATRIPRGSEEEKRKSFYCLAKYDSCRVTYGEEEEETKITCLTSSHRQILIRGGWPVLLFLYACLAYIFLASEQGASARDFLFRKLWAGRCGQRPEAEYQALERSVERLEVRNPDRAMWLLRQAVRRRRLARRAQYLMQERQRRRRGGGGEEDNQQRQPQQLPPPLPNHYENDAMNHPRPTELVLKTRIFTNEPVKKSLGNGASTTTTSATTPTSISKSLWTIKNPFIPATTTTTTSKVTTTTATNDNNKKIIDSDDDEDEDENFGNEPTCAICLTSLEQGDRVGDLSCGHTFHVDCLKTWLKRKNQCPLCNRSHVAHPRYTRDNNDDENGASQHPNEDGSTEQEQGSDREHSNAPPPGPPQQPEQEEESHSNCGGSTTRAGSNDDTVPNTT